MVSRKIIVKNKSGLHLRPAGVFVKAASNCKSDVKIYFKGQVVEAKSVLNVMAAGITAGSEIELVCRGSTEKEDLKTLLDKINSGLGE